VVSVLDERGRLERIPLPRLLLDLEAARFTGTVCLSRDAVEKRIVLREGVPLFAESNLASESLGVQLMDAGLLSRDDYARVVERVKQRGCKEGTALLELELLRPKDLFLALREQVRRRILDAFVWPAGEFELLHTEAPSEEAQAFRLDPVSLARDGLAAHWSLDRLFAELGPRLGRHPRPTRRFDRVAARLGDTPAVQQLCSAIDGVKRLDEILRLTSEPEALAALWVLEAAGAIEMATAPLAPEAADPELPPEIELVVSSGTQEAPRPGPRVARSRDAAAPGQADSEALRAELLDKHARIGKLDHYEALGIERNASAADVKRAYIRHAKRFHPDALGRLGLQELAPQANELFARVGKAYEVLSDPDRRRTYDAGESEEDAFKANRLAEAEVSYRKGELLLKMGNFAGALPFLKSAVDLWPDEAEYQGGFGWALFKNRPPDPKAARKHLERALELGGEQPQVLLRLGFVLRALGEIEQADRVTARAKALDPKGR
jgi:tetratricopeptide (TPR) repeat protein